MRRLSPSSQLVLAAIGVALVLVLVASARTPAPTASAPSASLTPTATLGPSSASSAVPRPSASSALTIPSAAANPTPIAPLGATASVLSSPTSHPTATPTPPAGSLTLTQLLSRLSTAPEQRTGYVRSLFVHWIDADGNGCDTRHEVLIDESLTTVTIGASCAISGGSWISLYDGLSFTNPSGLDIDHVVPLAEAWDSGAYAWSADRRRRFANDLDVSWSLIAVSAASNRSKGDQDPAEWLPPASDERCSYLGDWLAVKVRWSLSVDSTERAALGDELTACPDERRLVVLAP